MGTGIKRRKWYAEGRLWGLLGSILCALLIVACGTPPPPAHPLSDLEPTPTDQGGPTNVATIATAQIKPIQIVNAQTHVSTYPGGQMNMTITTSPYALCSFSIDYGRGKPSSNTGVVSHTADGQGRVSWTWRVDNSAHTGSWPLTINALLPNGAKTSTQMKVQVTLPPITIVSAQTNLRAAPQQDMLLTIATAPGTSCLLVLSYGPSRPTQNLRRGANVSGIASWTWRVDNLAPAGVWPLTITVTLADGESISMQVNMTVI